MMHGPTNVKSDSISCHISISVQRSSVTKIYNSVSESVR